MGFFFPSFFLWLARDALSKKKKKSKIQYGPTDYAVHFPHLLSIFC